MIPDKRNLSPEYKAGRAQYMRQWFWIRAPLILLTTGVIQLLLSGNPLGRAEIKYFVELMVVCAVFGLPIYRLLLSRLWDEPYRRDHPNFTKQ